jgi:four helix bundle protein
MSYRFHRDLIVWQKAMLLAEEVYRLAGRLPRQERFGMAAQLRSAAVSVAANIAEGNGRSKRGDYARFLTIARGSARELDTHLELSVRLHLANQRDVATARALVDEVCRMLTAMLRRLDPMQLPSYTSRGPDPMPSPTDTGRRPGGM